MLLKDLQTLATKLATGTLFHVEKAGKAYSVDYSALAKAIIEEYADSTVGGSKQSVQAAIAALNSRTDGTYNVRVKTSTNGSFACLCNADGTYAVYVNDANGKYCYGQFTIMAGKSYNWVTVSNDTVSENASNNQGTIVFTGGTAPYTAKVVRQTYTPSNATLETLNSRTFWRNQIDNVTISANSDTVLTLTKSTKAFMFITSANPAVCGVFICSATSTNSNVAFLPVLLGSALSLSADGNQLIITNSSASVAYAYGFIVDGSGITA